MLGLSAQQQRAALGRLARWGPCQGQIELPFTQDTQDTQDTEDTEDAMAGDIRWGLHRGGGGQFHAWDAGSGKLLCNGSTFREVPPDQVLPGEQYAERCRGCRVAAWERTNPGLRYPVSY